MSHIVQIKTEVRDFSAVQQACRRLKLAAPVQGRFKLFAGEESGCGVRLRDWRYPVVCQLETGQLKYDNFGGRWGDPRRLDEFLQGYAVEKTRLEARSQGYSTIEQRLPDGSVKLTINVGENG